jgi:hypothetical protein
MVSFATPRCTRILLFAAAIGALILAGCGGGDSSQGVAGTAPGVWGQSNWDQATWQ